MDRKLDDRLGDALAGLEGDAPLGVLGERGLDGRAQRVALVDVRGTHQQGRERVFSGHLIDADGDRLGVPLERDFADRARAERRLRAARLHDAGIGVEDLGEQVVERRPVPQVELAPPSAHARLPA